MSVRDITLEDTIDIKFTTRSFSTGAPTTLAGTPVISAYPGNSVTQLTAGITLTVDFDSVTGLHNVRVVATAANGYAASTDYALVITTGTVGGVSVVGEVIGEFTTSRTAAAVDLANTTDGLGAIKSDTAATLVDTGTTLDARIPAALVGGRMDASVGAMAAGVVTATAVATGAIDADALAADAVAEIADGVWDELQSGHVGAGTFGEIATEIADVLVDTAEIGAAGAGLTGINLPDQTMNITGNLSGSVGSVTGAVGSVTGAVGSVTGAVGSVTGDIGGLAAGAIADVWTTALTEAYAADGAAFTAAQALFMLWAFMAEKAIVTTTLTANKLDGVTAAMTFTLDDGTNPTSVTRAT